MITYGVAEVLSRSFATCILPTEPELRAQPFIVLPNGRRIPVCKATDGIKVSFFCDVLWNGVHDYNYTLMPAGSLKYAYLCYDSDQLPPRWTQLLNQHFDLIIASSPEMINVAIDSQVETPIATLPIPLDIESLLAKGLDGVENDKIRFGSIVAFHPRKGVQTLVRAFIENYSNRQDEAELILHSNLSFGEGLQDIRRMVAQSGINNIIITHGSLSHQDKNNLISTFDVFVNCSRGEGYSIGAREALAYGKSLILSDVGAHKDLIDLPGVFTIDGDVSFPARYPEIDNGVFGRQKAIRVSSTKTALKHAFDFVRSDNYKKTIIERRRRAHIFTFTALTTPFAMLVDPTIGHFRHYKSHSRLIDIPDDVKSVVLERLGPRANSLSHKRRKVIAAHDGGLFSIFNAFMNHLTWDIHEDRCHCTLPDWDVDRLIERLQGTRIMSFCYGRPGDGNIWTRLFEPLHGLTAEQMNDRAILYQGSGDPLFGGDYSKEPFMTYVHAHKLYRSRDFLAWRKQYHTVFNRYIHLLPHLQAEIDCFARDRMSSTFMIAAHVRHPSHTVEQPDHVIAGTEKYIRQIYELLAQRGIQVADPDWGVFLATDQEKVVRSFQEEFGDRVAYFEDVRRTRASEDAAFEKLSDAERNQEGYQLQHLVAASRDQWTTDMAWEVIRDAYCMARCNVLLHVVSNVSTAVSYMNPDTEMVFCSTTHDTL
ncbi:glycosyltransferase [Methylobacterium sp. CM6244]